MRNLFGAAIALVPAFSIVVACSSNTPTPDAGPPPEICPSTIVQASTAGGDGGEGTNSSCHVDGYVCVIGFECADTFFQQAKCTCTLQQDGTHSFNCFLETDNSAVPPGTTDPSTLCKSVETVGDASVNPCPTETAATTTTVPCTNPGQVCNYLTKCTSQPPPVDTCQCTDNANGDAGLSWTCDINNCP
jgi:hypothetical protein